jgi:signal peptidase I
MPENQTPEIRGDEQNRRNRFYSDIYEWVGTLSFVLVVFVLLFSFVFREVGVDGISMMNTLNNGDRLIMLSIGYKPQHDDIVVIYVKNLQKPIVKRVIATAGQTVNIDYAAHRVYVNGVLQDEPFIKNPTAFMGNPPILEMPVTVPAGCVFVMGDNRNESIDSRSGEIGMINTKYILGKAIIRYFPTGDMKFIK